MYTSPTLRRWLDLMRNRQHNYKPSSTIRSAKLQSIIDSMNNDDPDDDANRVTIIERYQNRRKDFHRLDGPAIILSDNTQHWYLNGQKHRDGGPASIWANGDQEWYLHNQLHRVDGPAIMYADGSTEYYINGRKLDNFEKWLLANTPK